jgi:transposase
MSVCIVPQAGDILRHRNMPAAPAPCLTAVAPYRDGLVGAVECLVTGDWLADRCAQEGIAFVLGHARYLQAIHGGKAKNDQLDSPQIAALRRGGRLPQAYVSPAKLRATRDRVRRRTPLMRKRAELFAHVHNPNSQYHLPESGKKMADKAHRTGGAERCDEAAVPPPIAVDLARITYADERRKDRELSRWKTAKPHEAQPRYRLPTVPGMGTILSLVGLYEIHQLARCPSGQAFASSCRLVKCRQDSAGTRVGTAGKPLGNAPLKWAFSEAAPWFWRHNPPGQQLLARVEKKHEPGKARSRLAHQLGRAVYLLLPRQGACELAMVLQTSGRRAEEPGASLDSPGRRL